MDDCGASKDKEMEFGFGSDMTKEFLSEGFYSIARFYKEKSESITRSASGYYVIQPIFDPL